MSLPPAFPFTPVPLKPRHDGWSPALQARFIAALASGSSIGAAARAVGKTRATAYSLRRKPGAEEFAAAWDAALAYLRVSRAPPAPPPPPPPPGHHPFAGRSRMRCDRLFDRLYSDAARAGNGAMPAKLTKPTKLTGGA